MKDMGKWIISIQFLIYAINNWLDLVKVVFHHIRLCEIAPLVGYIGCKVRIGNF